MIVDEILNILKADSTLKSLLGVTARDPRIYEFDTKNSGNVITYTFTTLTSDKVKEQSRFECNCISEDREKSLEIQTRVKQLLLTKGDESLTHNILSVVQNGGGSLKDAEKGVFKEKVIFVLNSRV